MQTEAIGLHSVGPAGEVDRRVELLTYLRRSRGRAGRLRDLGLRKRYLASLLPDVGPRINRLHVPLAMRMAGVRPSVAGGDPYLRLPGGMVLFAPPGEEGTVNRALTEAFFYHWRNVALLDQYDVVRTLKPGMVVLDLGANTGGFTILASQLVGPTGLVVAVEPCAANFRCLEKTIRASGLDNARAVQTAVGDHEGEVSLSLSHASGKHSAVLKRSDACEVVPLKTSDSVVEELGLERVDFLKVDVEGMEPEVLRGAAETIRRYRPRLAVSAYHFPEHATVLPQVLAEVAPGYSVEVRSVAVGLELEMFAVPRPVGD